MKYFQNVSIRNKLIYIFLIWLIAFLDFGIFAINQLGSLKDVATDIAEYGLKVGNSPIKAQIDLIKMHRGMKDLVMSENESEIERTIFEMNSLERKLLEYIDIIVDQLVEEDKLEVESEFKDLLFKWNSTHEEVISLVNEGKYIEAKQVVDTVNTKYVEELEEKLNDLTKLSNEKSNGMLDKANRIENKERTALILTILIMSIFIVTLFVILVKSILKPITDLKEAMAITTNTDELKEVSINGKNEIVDISKKYNILIKKLREQFWIKDGQNLLSKKLSGDIEIKELCQIAINFLARELDAGNGVFYIFDNEKERLDLITTFAFGKIQKFPKQYTLGEGIIGQVAIEKQSILLKDINVQDKLIRTGIINEAPLNTYAFPLIYEDKLYGVIELASFEPFTEIKQDYIKEMSQVIAIALYSIQNKNVKELLKITEEAKREIEEYSRELQEANIKLEKQQVILHEQTAELEQTNAQLEEQQQILEQQSRELQEANSELEEKQRMLEEVSNYKSEFIANVSHELRTPLNSIILLSKLLSKNGELSENDIEKTQIIHNSGKELLRLIDNILDLSKIESGKIEIELIEFESEDLVKELESLFKESARAKELKFITEDLLNRKLIADKNKISQILRNFISNAIKFTSEGVVSFRIMPEPNFKDTVLFVVSDTGIGIPQDKQEMIFQKFEQVDGSVSRKYGGTGLGLSIAKKIAEEMEGHIELSSEENKGSIFTLRLNNILHETKNITEKAMIIEKNKEIHDLISATSEFDLQFKNRKTILIIEDDNGFAKGIKQITDGLNLNTLIANTGQQGLSLLNRFKVDGILLDLGLPDISGIDILKELKSSKKFKTIPIHIITAWDKNSIPKELGTIGFDQKPINEENISEIVSKMLNYIDKKEKYILIFEKKIEVENTIADLIKDKSIKFISSDIEEVMIDYINSKEYDLLILNFNYDIEESILKIFEYIEKNKIEIPIVLYTNERLDEVNKRKFKKYLDRIGIKAVNSYEKLLDEIAIFLHRIKMNKALDNYNYTEFNQKKFFSLKDKNILVADDDPRNVFVLATIFEEYGANIHEAENGEVALNILEELMPDLIIMDIMMPVMNGYETINAIRRDVRLKNLPIIALTAKSQKEDKAKCIDAGANDYVSKPVDYDTLLHLVNAWINKNNNHG